VTGLKQNQQRNQHPEKERGEKRRRIKIQTWGSKKDVSSTA
jgi:hypothetical protein